MTKIQSVRIAAAVTLVALFLTPALSLADDTVPLRVVDSAGTVVGRLNGENVLMIVDGQSIQIGLRQIDSGLSWDTRGDGNLLFYSSDCTGVAYLIHWMISAKLFGTMPGAVVNSGASPVLYFGHNVSPQRLKGPWHSTMKPSGCHTGNVDVDGSKLVWILDQSKDLGGLLTPMHVE